MQTSSPGTLFGIGVGPGAPDLLTLRAVKALHHVDVILAAASPKNDDSLALSIASSHLPKQATTVRLDFPMTRDTTILESAWIKNAQIVANILIEGKNAAFLTLGDPLIYSTFGYLMRTLKKYQPAVVIEIISGITSFQAAAAATQTILCEGNENFSIIAGINTQDTLQKTLASTDSAAILKTYRNAKTIYKVLNETAQEKKTIFASRLGHAGEIITDDVQKMPEHPHYLSLLLVTPQR